MSIGCALGELVVELAKAIVSSGKEKTPESDKGKGGSSDANRQK
jgi:hypothetical protein